MPLSPQEQAELDAINQELGVRQQAPVSGLSSEEQAELAMIEQELATRKPQAEIPVNPQREADLGFVNRSRYSIEPLQSNRMALLAQEYGQENVMQDKEGNLFLNQNGEFRPVNKEGFSVADVADFAGATPEMAGSAVGLVAGAVGGGGVASVPAAIGLGAAGGAVGSVARQGLSALLGTPQVANTGERIVETGLSSLFGGATAGGGVVAKRAMTPVKEFSKRAGRWLVDAIPGGRTSVEALEASYKATSNVIDTLKKRFNPRVAEDADKFFSIAKRHGIDTSILPEAVEFGHESVISRSARHIAETPFGEQKLKSFYKAQGQVTNAIDDVVNKLSPERLASGKDAGGFLIQAVNNAKTRMFDGLDETYSSVVKNFPGLKLSKGSSERIVSKLDGIEKFAKGRIARGIGSQKTEAKSLLEAVGAIRKSNGSLKQTVEALRNIGEEAFKKGKQNRLPIDQKRLQGLYFDLQKEVIETVRENYGDDVAENLIRNNKMISDFLGESSVLNKVIGRQDVADETVFKNLISNGDSRKIEAIKAILPREEMAPIKAAALDSVIVRNADGLIMYDSTIKALQRKKDMISALFEPEELVEIGDLLRLGKRMGDPVLSSSGTGASNAFSKIIDDVKGAVVNEGNLETMKQRARRVRPSATKIVKPSSPKYGRIGNILTDSTQREAAYYSRGPRRIANDEKEQKNNRRPGGE